MNASKQENWEPKYSKYTYTYPYTEQEASFSKLGKKRSEDPARKENQTEKSSKHKLTLANISIHR